MRTTDSGASIWQLGMEKVMGPVCYSFVVANYLSLAQHSYMTHNKNALYLYALRQ